MTFPSPKRQTDDAQPLWIFRAWALGGLSVLCFLLVAAHGTLASSLIYKNFIVRYDRGWDILCEPYVVKKGDWVIKIFRQKGEIAHQDFREFLGIFQRLNPHVQDIDLIRPGQSIDIPLRKLEHGALPGQDSGVVAIPFVSLSKVMDVIIQNAQPYKVQRGDTVSEIVAKHFGRYGSKSYEEGVKMLQAANPGISDIDKIYAGQKIYLPNPEIREKQWYNALYDEKGNLRENIDKSKTPPSAAPAAAASPATASPANPPTAATEAGRITSSAPPEAIKHQEQPQDVLAQAAATVGGKLINRGTYFIPRTNQNDFEIDLSKNPLMDMQNKKLLFTQDGKIMGQAAETVESNWPAAKVVQYDAQGSVQEVVGAIFQAIKENKTEAETKTESEVSFSGPGIHVAVRAKWIKTDNDQQRLCITPIASSEERTPDSFRRYLEQNGIVLKEILPNGSTAPTNSNSNKLHAIKNVLALAPTNQKSFIQELCHTLKFAFTPNVPVNFTYAGIQIQAFANLVSAPSGNELLVDFGDLYGDAVKAIRQSGLEVLQFTPEENYTTLTQRLLTGLGENFTENPSFLAAPRPAEYNATVIVAGYLYTNAQGQRTFLAGNTLPSAVIDLISAEGIAVVTW